MGKLKDMYTLQKKAKEIKQQLQNTHIEAEVDGIIVIVNGEQEIIEIKIPDEALQNSTKLAENLKKALTKGIKKSQEIAATMMKDIMGDMNMGGLLGT